MSASRATPIARSPPFTPPALVPPITSTRATDRVRSRIRPYGPRARISRSISAATPPIHTARLTPPVITRAIRISWRSSPWIAASDTSGFWPILGPAGTTT